MFVSVLRIVVMFILKIDRQWWLDVLFDIITREYNLLCIASYIYIATYINIIQKHLRCKKVAAK